MLFHLILPRNIAAHAVFTSLLERNVYKLDVLRLPITGIKIERYVMIIFYFCA